MKHCTIIIFTFLVFNSFGQGNLTIDSLKGWWRFSENTATSLKGEDTLIFNDINYEIFLTFGLEFLEKGKYKTYKYWPYGVCGNLSAFEKMFGADKTKYRKGKWKLITLNGISYLTLKDSKLGKRTYQIIDIKDKMLTVKQTE